MLYLVLMLGRIVKKESGVRNQNKNREMIVTNHKTDWEVNILHFSFNILTPDS